MKPLRNADNTKGVNITRVALIRIRRYITDQDNPKHVFFSQPTGLHMAALFLWVNKRGAVSTGV